MNASVRENIEMPPRPDLDHFNPGDERNRSHVPFVRLTSSLYPPRVYPDTPEEQLNVLQNVYRTEMLSIAPHIHRLAIILGYPGAYALPTAALALPNTPLVADFRNLTSLLSPRDDTHTISLILCSLYVVCHATASGDDRGSNMFTGKETNSVLYLLRAGALAVSTATVPDRPPRFLHRTIGLLANMMRSLSQLFNTNPGIVTASTEQEVARLDLLIEWIRQIKRYIEAEARPKEDATAHLLQMVQQIGPSAKPVRIQLEAAGYYHPTITP